MKLEIYYPNIEVDTNGPEAADRGRGVVATADGPGIVKLPCGCWTRASTLSLGRGSCHCDRQYVVVEARS